MVTTDYLRTSIRNSRDVSPAVGEADEGVRAPSYFASRFLFLTLLLLGACATPKAPTWKPVTQEELKRPLTLNECLELAKRNTVRAADWKARLATARAELTTARALPNPSFSASWEDLGVKDAEKVSLANSTYGLSYPIFFWWTRGPEVAAAKKKLLAEQHGIRADQNQVDVEVGNTCFTLLAAERKERATGQLLAEARDAFRLADESFKLGSASGHDVALARTEVTQAEAELFDARAETRAQRLALAFALGADRPIAVRVQDAPLSVPLALQQAAATATSATLAGPVPQALIKEAVRLDPAYARARANREAAEAELKLEYRKILPLAEAEGTAARKDDPEGMGYNLGFAIPIPLFNWNQGGVRKARAELLAAQAEEEKARREAVKGLDEAWESWLNARLRRQRYSGEVLRARARLAGDAQDLFAAGQIDYSELIQARRDWREAELKAVDSWSSEMTAGWKVLSYF